MSGRSHWFKHFCLSGSLLLLAAPGFPSEARLRDESRERRQAYLDRVTESATLIVNREHEDLSEYVPDKDFYYLTGCAEPGGVLLLIPGGTAPRETLFLAKRDRSQERWTGPRMGPSRKTARHLGIERVVSLDQLPGELARWIPPRGRIYANLPRRVHGPTGERCCLEPWVRLCRWLPEAEVLDAGAEIAFLRMKKSAFELERLQQAIDITVAGHRQALGSIRPGRFEYQVEAAIEHEFRSRGATRPAFPSIVGSGPNSTVLHYAENNRRMNPGDLIVIDVGAEFDGYSADLTRTYPVSGRFTKRQREIYSIVLGAQEAALKQVRPGAGFGHSGPIHQAVLDYLDSHGQDRQGRSLGRYFIHGTGHHLGLDVHDPVSDRGRPLEAGMVITIEPGIYIPDENLGIRIEDDILVTEEGYRLLSRGLPRRPEDIERMMDQTRQAPGGITQARGND